MANYDSRDFEQMDFAGRFPRSDDVVGVDHWVRLIAGIRDHASRAGTPAGAAAVFREFDQFLRSVVALKVAPRTARVFVSHQRNDWREVERVAWHATEVGFEYWLDVHDPDGNYLSLAFCAPTELDLQNWFAGQPGARHGAPNRIWPKPCVPAKLPN